MAEHEGNDRTDRRPVLDSYGRLSRVPETGELEKIETQWADNRRVIERYDVDLGEELSDGLSAWKRKVKRPGWERLLERVQSGESDGVVVWHTDRLFRQPRDLERLIDLADKGFRVYSAHGHRDLSNPDDRFILRIEVAHAARSSDDASRRIKRRKATLRAKGVAYIGGPRRFGWPGKDRAWKPGPGQEESDRPDVTDTQLAAEHAALRDGTDAHMSGVSTDKIAADWNKRGLRTAAGLEWDGGSVKGALIRPTNAGLIEHDGKLVGRAEGDPIVDPEKFERLRSKVAARRRGRQWGEVGARYIASGVLVCGVCDSKLYARTQRGTYPDDGEQRWLYYCNPQRRGGCGKVSADGRAVERELRNFTIVRLSDSRFAAAIEAARAKVAVRLAEVRDEITECEAIQEDLAERLGRREMRLAAYDRANKPLQADLERLNAEKKMLEGGSPEGPVQAQSREEIAAQWDAAEVPEKRGMFTRALGREQFKILPPPRKGAKFDRDRTVVEDPRRKGGKTA